MAIRQRPATLEKLDRSSFSSIREKDSDLAQSFTVSKVSTYNNPENEHAVDDLPASPAMATMVQAEYLPPLTHPGSKLHGYWYPADGFKGWKQINVRGKPASRSFGDLHALNLSWNDASPKPKATPKQQGAYPSGQAPIETLPIELLSSIINLLLLDVPPNGIAKRNVDLMSLLLTSRTIHQATLNTLYRHITIPHSRVFHKFLLHISTYPALGTIVRRLDFCHLNPISTIFSSQSERLQARWLTSDTLLQCLELTPYLQEALFQEYLEDDLDPRVLRKLFMGLSRLRALDFCGCSSTIFKNSFSSILLSDWPMDLPLERLSFHKCLNLPPAVFETLLPRLPRLTHLDLAGTQITNVALESIPPTARITHLNLAKGKYLSAKGIIHFLSSHPAVTSSLVWLSLATDARTSELLNADAVTELLPILPSTLKSLNLKGSRTERRHLKLLLPLTKHLEELALGRGLGVADVDELFVPEVKDIHMWVPHTLRFLDLSDLWGGDFDITTLYSSTCALMTRDTLPLEVIEVSEDTAKRLSKYTVTLRRLGWKMSELGTRSWLVRDMSELKRSSGRIDDGRRSWKMGAESWGMRKIPVARADVGGMYGSYMFARKL
ncbi:Leucine Rich Repeat domain-containing protein [Pleurostoma richardsiae]|uniref:Leucine Rich Repeat domain-containing protein n=1 Tax=Pleurostoma richardsiae TaxID=41990 RepID=A0AA38VBS7_9PEZI|nr:Leucine Rich Repeat domain-containing protein [Pleurostoma richardsiae]